VPVHRRPPTPSTHREVLPIFVLGRPIPDTVHSATSPRRIPVAGKSQKNLPQGPSDGYSSLDTRVLSVEAVALDRLTARDD
jgi:hypothetical protein